jgi:hypothetical protein
MELVNQHFIPGHFNLGGRIGTARSVKAQALFNAQAVRIVQRIGNIRIAINLYVIMRRFIGDYLRAVDSLPFKNLIRKTISVVPVQFGGDKVVHTALFQDLRHGAGESEDIGHPAHGRISAEFTLEKLLGIQGLADQCFLPYSMYVKLRND